MCVTQTVLLDCVCVLLRLSCWIVFVCDSDCLVGLCLCVTQTVLLDCLLCVTDCLVGLFVVCDLDCLVELFVVCDGLSCWTVCCV